jgi:hypothetical protein
MDSNGRLFTYTGTDITTIIGEDKVESVGQNSSEIVQKTKMIKAHDIQLISSGGGDATVKIGSEDAGHPEDTLVTKPHLDKFNTVVGRTSTMFLGLNIIDKLVAGLYGSLYKSEWDPPSAGAGSLPDYDNHTNVTVAK